MKKYFFLLLAIVFTAASFAQLTPTQRIQDSVLSWWTKFDPNQKLTPIQSKKGVFTVKQQQHTRKIIEWMMKTYTPVAGLGTYKYGVNSCRDCEPEAGYPFGFGIDFRVWNVGYDEMQNGKFRPTPEEYTKWIGGINIIPSSYPVYFLNTGPEYFFVWPPDGYSPYDQERTRRDAADPAIFSNMSKFILHKNEGICVFLAPNNKLPFIPVTIGEYLEASLASLDKSFEIEKKKVIETWQGNDPNRVAGREKSIRREKEKFDGYRASILKWKEKYRNQLNQPAIQKDMQPTIISQYTTSDDPFEITAMRKQTKHYYPIYKIDAATLDKCKTDQPQWIAFDLPYKNKEDGNQLYEMFTAVSQHFNFEYAYNYFFNPAKVAGVGYKPVNEQQLLARLDGYRKRNSAAISPSTPSAPLPAGIIFMDNFTSSSEGSVPANWFFRNIGNRSTVTTIPGKEGKWVTVGRNNAITPSLLKKPLPQNFLLEFDIATDGDFTGRTGAAIKLLLNSRPANIDGTEVLSGNGARAEITIESGNEADYTNNNYRGIVKMLINATPSQNTQNYTEGITGIYALKEFTNKKTSVHVALQVKDNQLIISINGKQVLASTDLKLIYDGNCVTCGFPAGTKINHLQWLNSTNDEKIKAYISNVKISKQ
jgi:hypothetical protein